MAAVITINRPDVVAMIEKAATTFTKGNKTEVVALAMRRLMEKEGRKRPLFGAHRGSVKFRKDVDLTAPTFDDIEMDAETGRELEH